VLRVAHELATGYKSCVVMSRRHESYEQTEFCCYLIPRYSVVLFDPLASSS
jgi:hypothetical protein